MFCSSLYVRGNVVINLRMPVLFFSIGLAGLVIMMSIMATLAHASEPINLNTSSWLGNLKLTDSELNSVKLAMQKSLDSPIDSEQQCGENRMDCVVRSAREWIVDGQKYREVVIDLHARGHASNTVTQTSGQWPEIIAQ